MRYRINPEWRDAVHELAYVRGWIFYNGAPYPLRFRLNDVGKANELLQAQNLIELEQLAIRPLIIEKVDSSTAP